MGDRVEALLPLSPPPDDRWVLRAACREADPDLFYSDDADDVRVALSYCERCPVADTCLTVALANGERFGVWGGTTERQRRRRLRRGEASRTAA